MVIIVVRVIRCIRVIVIIIIITITITITINGIDKIILNKLRSINVDPLIVPLNVKNLFIFSYFFC